jgi:Mce-associated membrane protein
LTDVEQRPSPSRGSTAEEPGWWRKLLRPGRFTVLVVILLLAGAAGYLGVRAVTLGRQADALAAERSTLVSLGGRYAVDVTSYDYRDLDGGFARVTAESTPSYAKQYRSASQARGPQLRQDKAVSTGQVVAAGVETETPGRSASVLVLVDQSVANSTNPPQVRRNQLRIALVEVGGRWLIDNVTVL